MYKLSFNCIVKFLFPYAGTVCDIVCAKVYDPVCGSDGVTYGNSCELRRAACEQEKDIKKVHDGPCKGKKNTWIAVHTVINMVHIEN